MNTFDTTKQKLIKLWEKTFNNSNILKTIDNAEELSKLSGIPTDQISKNIIEIHDSGNFAATLEDLASIDTATKTVNKSELLPNIYSFLHSLTLELPEIFLPFIKIVTQINNVSNSQLSLGLKFVASKFIGDIIQVKGDGTLLYEGAESKINESIFRINTLLSFFTPEELVDFKVPIGNTKKVFEATIEYTDGTDTFRIIGPLLRLRTEDDLGQNCGSNEDINFHDALVFKDLAFTSERFDNEFINLTSTSFSIRALKIESRFAGADPPCDQTLTQFDGVVFNSTFSAVDRHQLTILGAFFKKVGANFQLLGNNQVVTVDSDIHTTISRDFEFIGHRAYYSSATQGILSVINTGQPDGSFNEIILVNFPTTTLGHTLPYTTIKLLRSPDPFPNEIETREIIASTSKIFKNFLKVDEDKFHLEIGGQFLSLSPSTVDDPNATQFPVYDDSYTIVGASYDLTDENHSISSKITFIPESQDASVRIKIFLQNPLYWKENRKYDF